MSIYTFETTEEMKTATTEFAVGDYIFTPGYYSVNDGGAGEFRIILPVANESADGYFTYEVNGENSTTVWASLIIKDGIVNIDQLGAQGDAVFDTPENEITSWEGAGGLYAYQGAVITANASATDNSATIQAALSNTSIKKIIMGPDRIYGVRNFLLISRSDVSIDGSDSTLLWISSTHSFVYMLAIASTSNDNIKNINVENIHFVQNIPSSEDFVGGVCAVKAENVRFSGVKSDYCRLAFAAMEDGELERGVKDLVFDNTDIGNCQCGIFLDKAENCSIVNSSISTDLCKLDTNGNDNPQYNSCICVLETSGCHFENLLLKNAVNGGAISDDNDTTEICCDTIISNINIENCKSAFTVRRFDRMVIGNVDASDIETAFVVDNLNDISVSNSIFKSVIPDEPAEGYVEANDTAIILGSGGACAGLSFSDCLFDFASSWFSVDTTRSVTGDDISFADCVFKAGDLSYIIPKPIAFINKVISSISFSGCRFEVERFLQLNTQEFTLIGNEYLFYISSTSETNKSRWFFDGCSFLNTGTLDASDNYVTVNSPILVDYEDDSNIFITVTNSSLKGFRWITRLATAGESAAYVSDEFDTMIKINPAFGGYPSSANSTAAIELFDDKERYLSHNNIYIYDTLTSGVNDTYYNTAEEYGLSV